MTLGESVPNRRSPAQIFPESCRMGWGIQWRWPQALKLPGSAPKSPFNFVNFSNISITYHIDYFQRSSYIFSCGEQLYRLWCLSVCLCVYVTFLKCPPKCQTKLSNKMSTKMSNKMSKKMSSKISNKMSNNREVGQKLKQVGKKKTKRLETNLQIW